MSVINHTYKKDKKTHDLEICAIQIKELCCMHIFNYHIITTQHL